jgi:hypothetical protein
MSMKIFVDIRLPAPRRDIVCDVSTVRLVLLALGAAVYAGGQYGVSIKNSSQSSRQQTGCGYFGRIRPTPA